MRIGFNLIIIPERESDSAASLRKKQAIEVAKITANRKVLLHHNNPISIETIFYISSQRMDILEKNHESLSPENFYIFDGRDPVRDKEKVIYSFETRWKNRELRLSEFE